MTDIPDPTTRRKKTREKILEGKKNIVVGVMNILLHKYLVDDYRKSYLKDESYILSNSVFQESIKEARINLQLDNAQAVPDEWKDWFRNGRTEDEDLDTIEFRNFRKRYNQEIKEIIKKVGLKKQWDGYIHAYMFDMVRPEKPFFDTPRTIRVTDIDLDGNIFVKLTPGVRYNDYTKAWKVFAKHLGTSERLEKPYTNTDRHSIYEDKVAGLSYAELAQKYFPGNPEASIDKIKKIVSREKIRRSQDK